MDSFPGVALRLPLATIACPYGAKAEEEMLSPWRRRRWSF